MPSAPADPSRPALSSLQIGLLVLLVVALLGSVGLRAHERRKAGQPGGAAGVRTLVDGTPSATGEPESALERSLPYVTEGSFFGLIGFALGYASRKFVKVVLVVVALFFLGLQALVWTGTVSVDWSGIVGKLNALVFNLRANESMAAFLGRRVPAVGGMLAGYLIGFQRR